MDGLIASGSTLAVLAILGTIIGVLNRAQFSPRWMAVAVLLVGINDGSLTLAFGMIPDLTGGSWNWQGKLLALGATLAIASLPAFGWRQSGFTLAQEPGRLKAALPICIVYCAFFLVIALVFPSGDSDAETIAFQLTMPGLEEELFYRGILLLALDKAFRGRKRLLGVDWGWGAALSCLLFGMTHAFGFADGQFTFDAIIMALTAIPSFLGVWLRLRTQSLLLPVLLHNFGNSFSFIVSAIV